MIEKQNKIHISLDKVLHDHFQRVKNLFQKKKEMQKDCRS